MSSDTITVSGITFSAEEVVSAVIKKGEREIVIQAKPEPEKKIGY